SLLCGLCPGRTISVVPLRRQIQEHRRSLTHAVDIHSLLISNGLVKATSIFEAGITVCKERLVSLPTKICFLIDFAPQLATEDAVRFQIRTVLHTEDIVEHSAIGAPLPMLIP